MTPTPFIEGREGVFFGIPAEIYHAAEGIGQSRLKDFANAASPAHYQASLVDGEKEPTPDTDFGTVAHTAILEPEKLAGSFYERPETYPAKDGPKPWTGQATWCKEWIESHKDRIVLPKDRVEAIPKVVKAVRSVPMVAGALDNGQVEVSHFKIDEPTGLLVKCRPDLTATDKDGLTWLLDFKKVQSGCASGEEFIKSVLRWGYHIQAASYLSITGASRFLFVAFDDSDPFGVATWELPYELMSLGAVKYREALDKYAQCVKSGVWPSYEPGIATLKTPNWVRKELGLPWKD